MKEGKPIAAGKDMGKGLGQGGKDLGQGVGQGGKDVGKGVKKAVSPKSDSKDPENK
jgi:hypothetical protein